MQSAWDSHQPPFYQCNETGKILDIMSRNPPVGDRKVPRKWSLKWWIYHHYILFCWGLPCYHKPTGGIFFPMAFPENGKSQVVTLLRWRVVELYYREVDELLYELSDLVGGWMDRWMISRGHGWTWMEDLKIGPVSFLLGNLVGLVRDWSISRWLVDDTDWRYFSCSKTNWWY